MPPFAIAYLALTWATEKCVPYPEMLADKHGVLIGYGDRNEYYNSKPGRTHDPVASDEATQGGTVRG